VPRRFFFDYNRQHSLSIKVARVFNTYGPSMHPNDGCVVFKFIVHALRGDPITVYRTGAQTRSFCYLDGLIDALVRLMNSPDAVTGPVNPGNPDEFSILELAQKVIALTGSVSQVVYNWLPADDPIQRRPALTLVHHQLGWQPTMAREKGLEKTIAYFARLPLLTRTA